MNKRRKEKKFISRRQTQAKTTTVCFNKTAARKQKKIYWAHQNRNAITRGHVHWKKTD